MKDCKITFTNRQTYDFSSKDLDKALAFCSKKSVYSIDTPWGVIQLWGKEEFAQMSNVMFDDEVKASFEEAQQEVPAEPQVEPQGETYGEQYFSEDILDDGKYNGIPVPEELIV